MSEGKLAARSRRARTDAPVPESAPDTPDAIEIALQAVAANADGHPLARAVLEKHARLLDVQCQREHEEWGVLRVQRWTRWLILGAVAALLLGLAALLWSASHSNSLVIEPFEVPPGLAQRGITGKVVASRVLDRLADLQRKTESMRGAGTYANDWQDDIKLDIPQTGIAIGEAWRTLKGWLGTQTRIGGEVTVEPDGALAITTRAGPDSGGTVTAPATDFDKLINDAALGLFRVTQPYRYAIARPDPREAIAALTALTTSDQPMERKWAFSGLSARYRQVGDVPRAVAMAQRALALDPELLPALGNLGHAYFVTGRDQAAIDTYRQMYAAAKRVGANQEYDQKISRYNLVNSAGYEAEIKRDPVEAEAAGAQLEALSLGSSLDSVILANRITAALLRHDLDRVARLSRSAVGNPEEEAVNRAKLAILLAWQRGDRGGARAGVATLTTALGQAAENDLLRDNRALAEAAVMLSQIGAGDAGAALIATLPADCYECTRARGWVALAAGRRDAARRFFADAVRQGPRLPAARVDLGRLDALEGDTAGALAQFREAARLAPNWADPFRYEGDLLARTGDLVGAGAAYAKAVKRAPRWGSLLLNQGRVLAAQGQGDAAAAAFAAAGRVALAPADRARLASARATRQ